MAPTALWADEGTTVASSEVLMSAIRGSAFIILALFVIGCLVIVTMRYIEVFEPSYEHAFPNGRLHVIGNYRRPSHVAQMSIDHRDDEVAGPMSLYGYSDRKRNSTIQPSDSCQDFTNLSIKRTQLKRQVQVTHITLGNVEKFKIRQRRRSNVTSE